MTSAFLRRQRYLIDYTLTSLARRKGKSLSLLLVYSAIVSLLASVMLFTHALRQEAHTLLEAAPEIVLQRMEAGRHALIPEAYLTQTETIRGVSASYGRLWGYLYDPIIQANYTVMVSRDSPLTAMEAVIGAGLARARGVAVGDLISFPAADGGTFVFEIKEIFSSESELMSSDLLLISAHAYRALFSLPEGVYTDIVLKVRNRNEVAKVAEKLVQRLPDTRPIMREEILRTYDAIFSWRQGIVLLVLVGAMAAFIIFAWEKASGLSGEERREIGILKAVGWETADIMRMKFWEGMILSFTAFSLGYLAAYIHVFWSSAPLFAAVIQGWATLYPRFQLLPVVDGLQLATLLLLTVLPYTVATIFPVWQAAITDPDEVMR
ncbi:MAG: FtsX-like permease family protein [Gammaproteobacteria bacterium]|nr:FtsX-like permease family protein [Gammaproteobacteria bacterium]